MMSIEIWVFIAGFIGSGVTAIINGFYTNRRRKTELQIQSEFNHLDVLQKDCRDLRDEQKELRKLIQDLGKENHGLRAKIVKLETEIRQITPLRDRNEKLQHNLDSIFTWFNAWEEDPSQHHVKCVMEAIKNAIEAP